MFSLEIVHVLVMHINNFVPVIVERSARRAAHRGCGDRVSISKDKKKAHRSYRHRINIEMHKLALGFIDLYEYDDSALYACRLTSWNVW